MIRSDYILRMIEECAAILRKIIGLRQEELHQQALAETQNLVRRLISADLPKLLSWDEAQIQTRLLEESGLETTEKTMLLAAALHEAGHVYHAQGADKDASACHLRALNLLLTLVIQHDDVRFPNCIPRIDLVAAALPPADLPMSTLLALMHYHERCGRYEQARQDLRRILTSARGDTELEQLGKAFYQRLLYKSDEELLSGGLSRQEVRSALADLNH